MKIRVLLFLAALFYVIRNKLIPYKPLNDMTEKIGLSLTAKEMALNLIKQKEGLYSSVKGAYKSFLVPSLLSPETKIYAYRDSGGLPTIGWGTTEYSNGKKVTINDVITKAQADAELLFQFNNKWNEIAIHNKLLLTDGQIASLVSFSYNIGTPALFKSTLWKMLQSGQDKTLVAEQFLRWVYDDLYKGGKVPVPGLVNRRKAEKQIFLT